MLRADEIAKAVEPFGLRIAQDALTFFYAMQAAGVTPDEVHEWVVHVRAKIKEQIISRNHEGAAQSAGYFAKAKKCPECGKPMILNSVNDRPGNQIGGKFKTQWVCPDWQGCGYDEFSRKNLAEQLQEYGLEDYFKSRGKKDG